ncbi:MAG: transporter substrate-binding domain-containing protein [Actinomycetota bacterium]
MLRSRPTATAAAMCLLVACSWLAGGTAAAQDDRDDVVVVTTEIEPFVVRDGDLVDGFYFEIWEDVAASLDLDYRVEWAPSFGEMLRRLDDGTADVAVAPLAPTAEREASYDFSSAVITSGPQLGVHDRATSDASLLRTLVGSGALRVLLFAALGLIVLGHVIWLVERRDEEGFGDFHSSWPQGAWDGIWWAAVTVTTVGYGDTAPRSTRGRLVAMLAMLASLFLVGAFVSQVTADLEAGRADQGIADLDDVGDRTVAVVAGSTFATYVESQGLTVAGYATQGEAFDAVSEGDHDIVVANPFALATVGPALGISATGDVLYEEFETFGFQQGSSLREPVNAALADLQSTGRIQRIIDRWID